jgi:hypothetical protein
MFVPVGVTRGALFAGWRRLRVVVNLFASSDVSAIVRAKR